MHPDALALVRASWRELAPHADAVASDFYARRFALDERAAGLFAHVDMAAQRAKLLQMLQAMVDVADDPGRLVSEAVPSGRRHAGYGATRRDYELAGAALLQAMAASLGDRWTPPVREAWRELYELLAAVMVRAGEKSEGARV